MFGHRAVPQLWRIVVVLELLVERTRSILPQHVDDRHECAIAGCLCDPEVEHPVTAEWLLVVVQLVLHGFECFLDRQDMILLGRLCRQCGRLGLDHVPRPKQFERSRGGAAIPGMHGPVTCAGRPGLNIDSGTNAHLDQALDLQCDQRLAHRGAGHAQLFGEVAFGRQARSCRKLPAADQCADLVRDLAIEAAGFDALERHGASGRPGGQRH